MKQIIVLCLLWVFTNVVFGQVDTVEVYSEVMDQTIPNLVITPKDYKAQNNPFFTSSMALEATLAIGSFVCPK